MSPEQALGFSKHVDERSDVFSLGVIFFEILSGQRPYPADSTGTPGENEPQALVEAPKSVPPPSARSINPAVPSALDRICLRAIAQDPQDRYGSARELADDLDEWLLRHKSGNARLSFTMSTIVMGLAAALLLIVGIQIALLPWNEWGLKGNLQKLLPQSVVPSVSTKANSTTAEPAATKANPKVDGKTPVTTKTQEKVRLIGNTKKGAYHLSTCSDVAQMNPSNRFELRDADHASELGLHPCGHCHPPISESHSKGGGDH
jgi:serine/threonine protein kinase